MSSHDAQAPQRCPRCGGTIYVMYLADRDTHWRAYCTRCPWMARG